MIGMQYFVPSVVSDMVAVLPFDVKLIYKLPCPILGIGLTLIGLILMDAM